MFISTSKSSCEIDISQFYIQRNDYEKLENIGKGGFAIKTFDSDTTNDEQRKYYDRECLVLATMNHLIILPLIGFTPFDEPNGPSIVMPLMKTSVQHYINLEKHNKTPIEWTRTRKHIILMGVAVGMAFLHSEKWIHRDLTPNNVLLDDSLEPRIADFGLAKFMENGLTISQSNPKGTVQYMAPEIFNGEQISTKVDVYSFGMMMFTVLSGLDPFPNVKNQMALMLKVGKGERPQIPETVRAPYAEIIRHC
jgi:serine/threonine protein kinase